MKVFGHQNCSVELYEFRFSILCVLFTPLLPSCWFLECTEALVKLKYTVHVAELCVHVFLSRERNAFVKLLIPA